MGEKIKDVAKNMMKGAGSVIDICPSQGKYTIRHFSQARMDADALKADWDRVGKTIVQIIVQDIQHEE